MGNEIFIENKKVCVKPLRNRLEAIQKLQPPKTPKGCRSFAGVVKFLSMFCPELQKLLKPIYNLTRKGRPFHWGKEQQHSLTKHLRGLGQMWTKYLSLATFAYNTFNSPNLGNYSPFKLTFGRKPKVLLNTETNPDIKVSTNFKEYYDLLNKRIKYLQDILFNFKSRRLAMINQNRENFQYRGGDLVYIISPLTSQLRTNS